MLYIENLSLSNIIKGIHKNRASESVLIQIVTPGDDFPKPRDTFIRVHQFEIADLIDREAFEQDSHFTKEHAAQIIRILVDAYNADRNVIASLCSWFIEKWGNSNNRKNFRVRAQI